jgi:hypothetical protein
MDTLTAPSRQWIGMGPPSGFLIARDVDDDSTRVAFVSLADKSAEARLARHFRAHGWGVVHDAELFATHWLAGQSADIIISDSMVLLHRFEHCPELDGQLPARFEPPRRIYADIEGTDIFIRLRERSLYDHRLQDAVLPLMSGFAAFALVHADDSDWPGFFPEAV